MAGPMTPNAKTAAGKLPTPDQVMKKMRLPEHMRQPFMAVLTAGLKLMFDAKSHQLMLQELQKPVPMAQKLGEGIAGLMALLFQQAHRSIAPQLLIPVGMVLMAHAADFLNKSGQPVSAQDYGEATHMMMRSLMRAFRVNPDLAEAAIERMGQKTGGKP